MEIISKIYKGFGQLILDNMPGIIMVDIWNGQTEPFWEEENNIALPAVFIDMRATDIKTIGENLQDLNIRATFHVAVESMQDTKISRNCEYTVSGIHQLTSQLYALLQGRQGDFFESPMVRTAIAPYEASTNILQIAQQFEFHAIDEGARAVYGSGNVAGMDIERAQEPEAQELSPLFTIDL